MTDTYFTGEPCRNGHIAPRYVVGGRCVECKREKDRRTYEANRDKRIAKAQDYHKANRETRIEQMREYHFANHEKALQDRRDYAAKNYDHLLAKKREYMADPANKAAKAAKKKEQAYLYRGYEQKRRARLKGAIPKWYGELDDFVMEQAAELCTRRQQSTGFAWEVDHTIPLLATRATGLHWYANLQVIPQTLNRQKNRRMILTQPREWIAKA